VFATQEIGELRARKQQLLAASGVNRQLLRLEMEQLRPAAEWVDRGYHLAQSLRPILKFALPVAGLVLARKRRDAKSLLANALAGWQIARKLTGLWKAFRTAAD